MGKQAGRLNGVPVNFRRFQQRSDADAASKRAKQEARRERNDVEEERDEEKEAREESTAQHPEASSAENRGRKRVTVGTAQAST